MRWLISTGRRWWRGLTSMRTALILLFLLAVAAIPGSLLPQRNVSLERVNRYLVDHPTAGPIYDRLALFDVFSSPWFSAIYLLLFVSLVGCLVPRLRAHAASALRAPGVVPQRLTRLPASAPVTASSLDTVEKVLRARRFRVARRDGGVSAEKGYLKETGNLIFHFALMVMLLGIGFGSWWGWHANRLVVTGADSGFCDTLQQYDEYGLGARISADDLPKFCVQVDSFVATWADNGQPLTYRAQVTYTQGLGAAATTGHREVAVNKPLRLNGANVYLLGHGYAPVLRYTDRFGISQTSVVPFLPADGDLTSSGVAVFPDANVDPKTGQRDATLQMAFAGSYLPTVSTTDTLNPSSVYPAERNPVLFLTAYRGNVGRDAGIPSSVYELDQHQLATGALKPVSATPIRLRPGGKSTLDDGTTIEFLGTRPWVTMAVRSDPGEKIVLVAAGFLLIGLLLSLTGKRRRIYARASGDGVVLGGLPRNNYAGFPAEFDDIVAAVRGGPPPEKAEEPAHAGAV